MKTKKELKSIENMPREKKFWYLKNFYRKPQSETTGDFYDRFYYQQTCISTNREKVGVRSWITKSNSCQKRKVRQTNKRLTTKKNRTEFKKETNRQINEYYSELN